MALMVAREVVALVIQVQVVLVAMEILAAGLAGKADFLVEQVDLVDPILDDQGVAMVDRAPAAQGILEAPIVTEISVILVVQIVVVVSEALEVQIGLVALEIPRVQIAQLVLEDLVQAALVDLVVSVLIMKIVQAVLMTLEMARLVVTKVLGGNFSSSFCKASSLFSTDEFDTSIHMVIDNSPLVPTCIKNC